MLFILLAFAWIVSIMLYVVCISIERQRLSYIALTLFFMISGILLACFPSEKTYVMRLLMRF